MKEYANLPHGVEHISTIVKRVMKRIENACKKNLENSNCSTLHTRNIKEKDSRENL